jgi:hypothetical protein
VALVLALLLGAAGVVLVAPALRSPPPPAHPWALWVGADKKDSRAFALPASWLLRLWIDADEGCGSAATVRGELQIARAYKLARSPRLLVLSVAGARIEEAEVKGILNLRAAPEPGWRRAAVLRRGGSYVVQAPLRNRIERNLFAGRVLLFRFRVDASRGVGHESCSISSPALFGSLGENQLWAQASAEGEARFRGRGPVIAPVMNDAIVHMSVPDRSPDRSELDAGAKVHGSSLLLTCDDGFHHFLPREAREDDFFLTRTRLEQSSCASVQTFSASDAAADLSRRQFFAAALISAAVGFLVAALGGLGPRQRRGDAHAAGPEI